MNCRHTDWCWLLTPPLEPLYRWCPRCGALQQSGKRWRRPVGKRRPRRDTAKRKATPASTAVQLPFAYNQEEN